MPLLLRVDSHVIAQGHIVGVRLVTIRAAEVANFVCIFVVQQTASMLVRAATKVTGKWAFFTLWRPQINCIHAHIRAVEGGRGRRKLGTAIMRGQICGCSKDLRASIAFIFSWRRSRLHAGTRKRTRNIFAELVAGMCFKLPLVPEAPTTVRAGIFLKSEMHSEVVLHCQSIWISGVAHVAVVFTNLM